MQVLPERGGRGAGDEGGAGGSWAKSATGASATRAVIGSMSSLNRAPTENSYLKFCGTPLLLSNFEMAFGDISPGAPHVDFTCGDLADKFLALLALLSPIALTSQSRGRCRSRFSSRQCRPRRSGSLPIIPSRALRA